MSKIIVPTIDQTPMNYCSKAAVVYVWEKGSIWEVPSTMYLQKRDTFMWKYAYLHDPSMGAWNVLTSVFKHGNFYVYKKNMKTVRKKNSPYQSALYDVSRAEVPKEFLTALLLYGVTV